MFYKVASNRKYSIIDKDSLFLLSLDFQTSFLDNNTQKGFLFMKQNKRKTIISVLLIIALLAGASVLSYNCGKNSGRQEAVSDNTETTDSTKENDETTTADNESDTDDNSFTGVSPNPEHEAKVNALGWQLSAECQGLILQSFSTAEKNLDEMIDKCNDPDNTEWTMETDADGNTRMMHNGIRVAIVSDIDDTLVNGAGYSADVIANDGDYNNAALARFFMSDSCTALPGAVEFVKKCIENGVDFYYITNRYDQAYKIGQSDSQGSYEESIKNEGKGLYCSADGTEIGSSLYQTYGKTAYDITFESMESLGFPVDDQHLIVNDLKIKGSSKEPARSAIKNGNDAYPNGQRTDGSSLDCATTAQIEAHDIVMLLGDNIGDFTDDFSQEGIDAVSRSNLASDSAYADKWGSEWILMPNAMYGASLEYAADYDYSKLFKYYSYTNSSDSDS
jgi:predicted secreted acid phosphatase